MSTGNNPTQSGYTEASSPPPSGLIQFDKKNEEHTKLPIQRSGVVEFEGQEEGKEPTAKERLESIIDFLDQSGELDIYQVAAFRVKSGNKARQNGAFWGYYIDIIKAFVIAVTQIVSLIILYINIFRDTTKEYCEGDGEIESKIMATCYSAFLVITIFTTFTNTSNAGFYLRLNYEDRHYKFVSTWWLHFGRTVNEITLIGAYPLSFFLILLEEDHVNMVLNSIALLFITEIDNIVVDTSDYLKLLAWFEKIKNNANSYSNGEEYIDYVFETEEMNKSTACIQKWALVPVPIIIIILLIAAPFLPIVMFICY